MGHGHPPTLDRVFELPVATFGGHMHPVVCFQHADQPAAVAFHANSSLCNNIHNRQRDSIGRFAGKYKVVNKGPPFGDGRPVSDCLVRQFVLNNFFRPKLLVRPGLILYCLARTPTGTAGADGHG